MTNNQCGKHDEICKTFERPIYGQVLVKLDQDEDGNPEVRWYVKPLDSGLCSFAAGFENTDKGWDLACI